MNVHWFGCFARFLHPITYGHYPETMEKIVGSRLPNFTYEQSAMVKGSADYIGINHYTTYYASHYVNDTEKSYRNDWNVKLSCTFLLLMENIYRSLRKCSFFICQTNSMGQIPDARNGVPIGQKVRYIVDFKSKPGN
jgi:hypothetical protein